MSSRLTAAGVAATAFFSSSARAADAASPLSEQPTLPSVEVTGTAVPEQQDIPQSIDTIDKKELAEQNLTLVQDALRKSPASP